ncbi:unnamed protein product [Amoebophrya sp. A120]|nr:unnamed protein product [Amoebophrya sp. A120]|eukprot:GSA120T00004721001.1
MPPPKQKIRVACKRPNLIGEEKEVLIAAKPTTKLEKVVRSWCQNVDPECVFEEHWFFVEQSGTGKNATKTAADGGGTNAPPPRWTFLDYEKKDFEKGPGDFLEPDQTELFQQQDGTSTVADEENLPRIEVLAFKKRKVSLTAKADLLWGLLCDDGKSSHTPRGDGAEKAQVEEEFQRRKTALTQKLEEKFPGFEIRKAAASSSGGPQQQPNLNSLASLEVTTPVDPLTCCIDPTSIDEYGNVDLQNPNGSQLIYLLKQWFLSIFKKPYRPFFTFEGMICDATEGARSSILSLGKVSASEILNANGNKASSGGGGTTGSSSSTSKPDRVKPWVGALQRNIDNQKDEQQLLIRCDTPKLRLCLNNKKITILPQQRVHQVKQGLVQIRMANPGSKLFAQQAGGGVVAVGEQAGQGAIKPSIEMDEAETIGSYCVNEACTSLSELLHVSVVDDQKPKVAEPPPPRPPISTPVQAQHQSGPSTKPPVPVEVHISGPARKSESSVPRRAAAPSGQIVPPVVAPKPAAPTAAAVERHEVPSTRIKQEEPQEKQKTAVPDEKENRSTPNANAAPGRHPQQQNAKRRRSVSQNDRSKAEEEEASQISNKNLPAGAKKQPKLDPLVEWQQAHRVHASNERASRHFNRMQRFRAAAGDDDGEDHDEQQEGTEAVAGSQQGDASPKRQATPGDQHLQDETPIDFNPDRREAVEAQQEQESVNIKSEQVYIKGEQINLSPRHRTASSVSAVSRRSRSAPEGSSAAAVDQQEDINSHDQETDFALASSLQLRQSKRRKVVEFGGVKVGVATELAYKPGYSELHDLDSDFLSESEGAGEDSSEDGDENNLDDDDEDYSEKVRRRAKNPRAKGSRNSSGGGGTRRVAKPKKPKQKAAPKPKKKTKKQLAEEQKQLMERDLDLLLEEHNQEILSKQNSSASSGIINQDGGGVKTDALRRPGGGIAAFQQEPPPAHEHEHDQQQAHHPQPDVLPGADPQEFNLFQDLDDAGFDALQQEGTASNPNAPIGSGTAAANTNSAAIDAFFREEIPPSNDIFVENQNRNHQEQQESNSKSPSPPGGGSGPPPSRRRLHKLHQQLQREEVFQSQQNPAPPPPRAGGRPNTRTRRVAERYLNQDTFEEMDRDAVEQIQIQSTAVQTVAATSTASGTRTPSGSRNTARRSKKVDVVSQREALELAMALSLSMAESAAAPEPEPPLAANANGNGSSSSSSSSSTNNNAVGGGGAAGAGYPPVLFAPPAPDQESGNQMTTKVGDAAAARDDDDDDDGQLAENQFQDDEDDLEDLEVDGALYS